MIYSKEIKSLLLVARANKGWISGYDHCNKTITQAIKRGLLEVKSNPDDLGDDFCLTPKGRRAAKPIRIRRKVVVVAEEPPKPPTWQDELARETEQSVREEVPGIKIKVAIGDWDGIE